MRRAYNKQEKALLDEMSRSNDPGREAQQHLEHELLESPIVRRAFIAELLRLRHYAAMSRAARQRLPVQIRAELERITKAKNFEHLVALAEARGEEPPEILQPEPGMDG